MVAIETDFDNYTDFIKYESINEKVYFIPVKKNNKYGVLLLNKEEPEKSKNIIPYEYDEIPVIDIIEVPSAFHSSQDFAFSCVKKDSQYYLFDLLNEKNIFEFSSEDIQRLKSTYKYKVKKDEKYAIYDFKNEKLGNFKYDDVRVGEMPYVGFIEQSLQVKKDDKWRYKSRLEVIGKTTGSAGCVILVIASMPLAIPGVLVLCVAELFGFSQK